MKTLATLLAFAALTMPALAQSRPSTTDMTCGQAKAYLASQGAAVIGTGGFTFDRFVVSRQFCEPTQTTREAFVPTRDVRLCMIGYTCMEPSVEMNDRE